MHDPDHILSPEEHTGDHLLPVGPDTAIRISELKWAFSPSSGPGGQKVNKTATRVTLSFNIPDSSSLTDAQKQKLFEKLGRRIDKNGFLHVIVEDERSQHRNRQIALERLQVKIRKALKPEKHRRKTSIPLSEREERLREKRNRARIKSHRHRGRRLIDDDA